MEPHTCPVPGCKKQVPYEQLACRSHWYALPLDLRNRVWRAYRGRSDEDHLMVVAEAIEWLAQRYGTQEELF